MLKPEAVNCNTSIRYQPPSGGCVLKQSAAEEARQFEEPAAFRRLRVETPLKHYGKNYQKTQPPSGGCVLKQGVYDGLQGCEPSRLQAAAC